MSSNVTNNSIKVSYTEKLSRNATVLSTLTMLPVAAQAGVVHVISPLTISIEDARAFDYAPVDWDVDGDSVADFRLEAFRTIFYTGGSGSGTYSSYGLSIPNGRLELNSSGLNGQGLVQNSGDNTSNVRNLTAGETVGPTLGSGRQWSPSTDRIMMTSSSYIGFSNTSLFGNGNLVGFRFDDGGQTLYGWAEISIDENLLEMTIEQWAYEDNGGGIAVGQVSSVPVPPAALLMLSGLAFGAGGVLRGRKLRKAEQEKQTANS